jgi:glutaryl-CoA dehydrogenase
MDSFCAVDFYQVDDLLDPEEKMLRDTVRSWVSAHVVPYAGAWVEQAHFPRELASEMGQLGYLGPHIPGEGSPEVGAVAYGLIQRELERGDCGIRSFASVQGSLVMYPIHAYGSEEQKRTWIPRLRNGKAIGCYALTEAEAGSNPGRMRTTAERNGREWILNGAKMWITNASIADVAIVFAKTPDGTQGFLVETNSPGVTTVETKHKWSLRASNTGELHFDDCRLPEHAVLPGAKGLRAALDCLNEARYGIAWGAIGSAMACYDEALRHAQDRVQFDGPIGGHQLVQAKLVEMVSEITKAQLLAYRLGRLKEEGRARFYHVSLAKRDNVQAALRIAREARDILGASGITYENAVGRHMHNLESVITYEGTHDIHTLIVGAHITGIEAFR